MSIIEEEQAEQSSNSVESSLICQEKLAEALEEYVPNMHLLDLEPSLLTAGHFTATLAGLEN